MEWCLCAILDAYDISCGYDSYKIDLLVDDMQDFLLETYTEEEVSFLEIENITEYCRMSAHTIIGSLFCAKKHSVITSCDQENMERSLRRLVKYKGDTQRSLEWFKTRYNMLTASVAYNILKVDLQKKTGITVLRQKILPFEPHIPEKGDVRIPNDPDRANVRGTRYEPIIRNTYEKLLPGDDTSGCVVEYDCVPHEKYPFLGASPDGIVIKGPLRGRMVEIKCPKPQTAEKDGNTVKKEYYAQIQLQLEVCNLEVCDYVRAVVWDSDNYEKITSMLHEKQDKYRKMAISKEIGDNDSKILAIGTMWMDSSTGEYVMERSGSFTNENEIYMRPGVHPAFIRHYFILEKDWMIIKVHRNREWFNKMFLPKSIEVWNEIIEARKDPDLWERNNPKKTYKNKIVFQKEESLFID